MIQKILVIRLSAMGDVIFTTPFVRIMAKQLNCEVHFLTKPLYSDLVKYNPYISEIHLLKEDLQMTIEDLKNEAFDFVFDLQVNIRSKRITDALSVKSAKVDKLTLEKYLRIYLNYDRLPRIHFAERCMKLASQFGIYDDQEGMDFFFPKDFMFEEKLDKNYLSVVLGASYFTKRIPSHIIEAIIKKAGIPIYLIGGKDVKGDAERIASTNANATVRNLVGKLTIVQSAYVLQHSELVIAPDTGMLHLAAALKKPTISIWGSTIPEFGVFPYYGNKKVTHLIFENKYLSCRPCSKHGKATCPKSHLKCLKEIDSDKVIDGILQILDKN